MTRKNPGNEDLRVQRTHRLILEALIELTVQKGFSAVTVRDIARRAGINRATFYRHYQDKFDLLDQYIQEVYQLPDIPTATGGTLTGKVTLDEPVSGLARMFTHIRAHAKFYRVMLGQKGDPAFAEKVRQYIQKRIRRSLPQELISDEKTVDLYLNFISSGSLGVVLWWLENGMPYSPEQMAAISYRLSLENLTAIIEQVRS
jgi:AcrR family transcriptional regulator